MDVETLMSVLLSEFIYLPPMPMESFRGMPGMPFMPPGPPATVFVPVPEPPLSVLLIKQIDYYFRYIVTTGFLFIVICHLLY